MERKAQWHRLTETIEWNAKVNKILGEEIRIKSQELARLRSFEDRCEKQIRKLLNSVPNQKQFTEFLDKIQEEKKEKQRRQDKKSRMYWKEKFS